MPQSSVTQRTLELLKEEWTKPYREALERIRDYEETWADPPEDAMREIAKEALEEDV